MHVVCMRAGVVLWRPPFTHARMHLQHAHVRPGSCAPRAHVELGSDAALFPEMMPTIDAVLMPRHGGDGVELDDH